MHIIYTPFTGVGLHGGYRGDDWFRYRIKLFRDTTVKSLMNQTNNDFIHWLSFRPEEKNHPYTAALAKYLGSIEKYKFVMTFDNLMYHDDKFSNYNLKTRARNFLQMYHDDLTQNPLKLIKKAWENKNKSLVERLSKSLGDVYKIASDRYEWVYMTRVDSDDMFRNDFVELIQDQKPEVKRALVCDKGYVYHRQQGRVADWCPPTNPPFHTIIFPATIFFDPQAHYEYYGDFKSHEDVPKVFNPVKMDDYLYMVSYHGDHHISTAWDSPPVRGLHRKVKYGRKNPFIGTEWLEADKIIKQFGL